MIDDSEIARLGAVPVTVAADEIRDGIGMIRVTASPSLVIAVLHDGSQEALERARISARLVRAAPTMLALIRTALDAWSAEFDGDPDRDLNVPGADFVDWFTGWRDDVRRDLTRCLPAGWL